MKTQTFGVYDNETYMRFTNPSLIHRDLESLTGIIEGIMGDHLINPKEHHGLQDWLHHTKVYEAKQPYKTLIEIIRSSIDDGDLTEQEGQSIIWMCNNYLKNNTYYDALTAGIIKLHGIVRGIAIDHEISIGELAFLDGWLEENEYLKASWPYDELYNLTTRILADKVITAEEHTELLRFCQALASRKEDGNGNADTFKSLSGGFYHIDPEIIFEERTFCITGISKKYKRKEIVERIELYGGFAASSVSKNINYLVVCDEKNSCWAFSCYGRKIEEAMYLRRNGARIVIVHENDLYDAFESFRS